MTDRKAPLTILMDQCVKLNDKMIVCMNCSPSTLLDIVKALKLQNADENLLGHLPYLGLRADKSSSCDSTQCVIECQAVEIHAFEVSCISTLKLFAVL